MEPGTGEVGPSVVAEATPAEAVPAEAVPAEAAPAEAPPTEAAPWNPYDDPRVAALLSDDAERRGPDRHPRPPKDPIVERLVDEQGIEVLATHGTWLGKHDDHEWLDRVARVDLVVRTEVDVHVALLARPNQQAFREYFPDLPERPRVRMSEWRGRGVPGPDLVLTVAHDALWETQCDEGFDRRTDVVVCDLEGSALRCARAPAELRFFDGCGGAESIEHEAGDPEDECGRVGYSVEWKAEPDALKTRIKSKDDVRCLDREATGEQGDPRPPLPSSVPYPTLYSGPTRIEVHTVPRAEGQPAGAEAATAR